MQRVICHKRLFYVVCLVCCVSFFRFVWADDADFEPSVDFEDESTTPTLDSSTPAPDPVPSLTPEQEPEQKPKPELEEKEVIENDDHKDLESSNEVDHKSNNAGENSLRSGDEQMTIDYTQKLEEIEDQLANIHNDNFKLMICIFAFMGAVLGFLTVREMLR